jgi:peptide chain release factor 1
LDSRQGEISIEVEGRDLTELNKEQGGHRIQRVPPTERRGRVHSSTVTVAVIDPKTVKTYSFNPRDFEVQWYSGTGSGGQHRNKHQNSCRIIHIETGVVSTAQCRSRENSFDEAKTTILARLNAHSAKSAYDELAVERKEQVGSGERGDKIRTYRFQDNTVKDHVTEKTARTTDVMNGKFDLLW